MCEHVPSATSSSMVPFTCEKHQGISPSPPAHTYNTGHIHTTRAMLSTSQHRSHTHYTSNVIHSCSKRHTTHTVYNENTVIQLQQLRLLVNDIQQAGFNLGNKCLMLATSSVRCTKSKQPCGQQLHITSSSVRHILTSS